MADVTSDTIHSQITALQNFLKSPEVKAVQDKGGGLNYQIHSPSKGSNVTVTFSLKDNPEHSITVSSSAIAGAGNGDGKKYKETSLYKLIENSSSGLFSWLGGAKKGSGTVSPSEVMPSNPATIRPDAKGDGPTTRVLPSVSPLTGVALNASSPAGTQLAESYQPNTTSRSVNPSTTRNV